MKSSAKYVITTIVFLVAILATGKLFAMDGQMMQGGKFGDIYFAKGSYSLDEASKKELHGIADWLKAKPNAMVLLAGYDDKGVPAGDSVEMGYKRATAVSDCLVSYGVNVERIKATSFGNTRPPREGTDKLVSDHRVRYRIMDPDASGQDEGQEGGGGASICQKCKGSGMKR